MKQTIIRLCAQEGAAARWLTRDPAGIRGDIQEGALADASTAALGGRVVVLVPASDVLLTAARLPSRQRRHILRAVPFALEEQLASDVDGLHFAVGQPLERDLYPVAVVARERMDYWVSALEQADIRPDLLIPESLALPRSQGEWVVVAEAGSALVRTAPHAGFAADESVLPELLALNLEQSEEKPTALRLVGGAPSLVEALEQCCERAEVDLHREPSADPLSVIAKGAIDPGLNLLQGDYSRREQLGRLWRPWRAAAGLLAAWMLLQAGMSLQDYRRLAAEEQALIARIEQVYREAFPDARKVVNAKVQMERQLQTLRQGGGDSMFIDLIVASAPALKQIQGLEVNSLRYSDGMLEFDLVLGDLQTLDRLKQALSGEQGLSVEIASAAARGSKVESRLQIRRSGA